MNAAAATDTTQITQLLRRWQAGDHAAREQLMSLVYDRVRAIARRSLHGTLGSNLTPTELAHEALMRLLTADASWEDRQHFYNVVGQATRQVLVDAARRRGAAKRGGDQEHTDIDTDDELVLQDDETLLTVNDALERLAAEDLRRARAIELTYFVGLERREAAKALGVSVATFDRDVLFGRAWLRRALET
jgi:RNA polymerase sigma factor (TIGR02999 family)